MNIYISGTPGVESGAIKETIRFLNKSKGPFKFIKSKDISETQLKRVLNSEKTIESFYFNQLTDIANFYRTAFEIEDDAFLIFLSDYKLDYEEYDEKKRWFSYFSDKNIIVKTYGWELYTSNREYLAISHQIIENVFQILSGLHLKSYERCQTFHLNNTTVCINSFSLFEEEIKIKLLSGVICESCITKFLNEKANNKIAYSQIDDILERVRIELKVKVKVDPEFKNIIVNEDGSIIIDGENIVFKDKYLHYIYLFFLINSSKWFTEKNIFEYNGTLTENLKSLIKCYNIVRGNGFTPPESNPIPKNILRHINNLNHKKSTFNSYRSAIGKFVPENYGFISLKNGNKTYRFSVNIPEEIIQLPKSFLGFRVND